MPSQENLEKDLLEDTGVTRSLPSQEPELVQDGEGDISTTSGSRRGPLKNHRHVLRKRDRSPTCQDERSEAATCLEQGKLSGQRASHSVGSSGTVGPTSVPEGAETPGRAPCECRVLLKESGVQSCKDLEDVLRNKQKPKKWTIVCIQGQKYLVRDPDTEVVEAKASDMDDDRDPCGEPQPLVRVIPPEDGLEGSQELQNLPGAADLSREPARQWKQGEESQDQRALPPETVPESGEPEGQTPRENLEKDLLEDRGETKTLQSQEPELLKGPDMAKEKGTAVPLAKTCVNKQPRVWTKESFQDSLGPIPLVHLAPWDPPVFLREQKPRDGHPVNAGNPNPKMGSMDTYEQVQKGPLKLKGGPELGVTKRKKKKDRGKAKLLQMMGKIQKNQEEELRRHLDKRTPAQVAFEKGQKALPPETIPETGELEGQMPSQENLEKDLLEDTGVTRSLPSQEPELVQDGEGDVSTTSGSRRGPLKNRRHVLRKRDRSPTCQDERPEAATCLDQGEFSGQRGSHSVGSSGTVGPTSVPEGAETPGRAPCECRKSDPKMGSMDTYEQVQKGPLKLKGGPELGVTKRKKKKDRGKAKFLQTMGKIQKNQEEELRHYLDKRTLAPVAFEKVQEKRQMERVLKKASITHKQRVEDFNRHLDTLSEHYDIPKVSWTK
ncbi:hypothetical protein JEQ12_005758 [Ovis aries]|uniref:Protein FAM32A n=1 Tax=Ovis aries TaxID=9940 RepID=A0A836CW57_SHEEP|nr:hypothetical protein JEQ12_005758 [Ovis aries]